MATTSAPDRWRPDAGAALVAAVLVTPLVIELTRLVAPIATIPGGLRLDRALGLLTILVALVAWMRLQPTERWPRWIIAWTVAVVMLVVYVSVVTSIGDALLDAGPILLVAGVALLALKRPSSTSVLRGIDGFAWALVLVSAVALVLEASGAVESFYSGNVGSYIALIDFDRTHHWLPFADLLNLDGRWGGVVRDPNAGGPLGAFLIVYGMTRASVQRTVFVLAGVVMLVLADSRTAYAALVLGLAVLVVLPRWLGGGRAARGARIVAAALGIVAAVRVLVEVAADPSGAVTATGRVTMWPDFASLWPQAPWTGVGDAGIAEAIADGRLAPWATQGHDVYLDALVRYGAIGLVLVAVVVVTAVVIALLGARQGNAVSLALIAMIAAVSLTEASFHWLYPTVSFSVLLVGVLLSPRWTPSDGTSLTHGYGEAGPSAESDSAADLTRR